MTNWEEIKRLAADFQKVQLTSTSQKLSERNCIEIITWLIEKKMIDLIFTSDGKEYMTPAQLIHDVHSELIVNGGRINLVDVAKALGVDLAHITTHLNELLKGQKDIHSVVGQLIHKSYILRIAGEINEALAQKGQINISDLTIQYDLPADFLHHQIEKHLGTVIHGKQDKNDPRVIYTETFIERSKAKIRGALAGITKPISVASILNHIEMNEQLFFSLFDQASPCGVLTARLHGAQYIPTVYSRSQNDWIQNFYKQNKYLEFDSLTRLGITDYKTYIKKHMNNDEIVTLYSCIVSKELLEQIEADIDECISSKSYIDLHHSLPSVFNEEDIKIIITTVLSSQKQQQTILINNFILSKGFVDSIFKNSDIVWKHKAKKCVESGEYQRYKTDQHLTHRTIKSDDVDEKGDKRDERRKKAAAGKSGGGTQGRETKTKSTKKAARSSAKTSSSELEVVTKKKSLEILSVDDIKEIIKQPLEEEGLDELVEALSESLLPKYQEEALQIADELYMSTIADKTANKKNVHNDVQNKVNNTITDIRLYEKGIKLVPSDLQTQLYKYLLKTLCTDVVNEILNYVATDQEMNIVTNDFNNDQRMKFVNDLPTEFKAPFATLIKSLSSQNVDDFMAAIEPSLHVCSMIIKKIDKKKDRSIILNHKHSLLEQMNNCDDLALTLHLAILAIFTTAMQCMLHASGKHIPPLLIFMKPYFNEVQFAELTTYQEFVTLMLGGGSEAESAKEKLKEKIQIVKNIANEYKKAEKN